MGLKPRRKPVRANGRLTFPMFDISYEDVAMYLMAVPAKTLFPACRVSRAHENQRKGYQRHLTTKRVKEIAEYLDAGNAIPGAIVLSAQDAAAVQLDAEANTLSFVANESAFLVIDGQHRLFGAEEAEKDVVLAVCVLLGLSQAEEVQYFHDVNSNQRGVPRTLEIEISRFTESVEAKTKLRIRLVHELNKRAESPLCGKIALHKGAAGKLTHVPFEKALDPLLDTQPMAGLDFEGKFKLLVNFLSAVEQTLVESMGDSTKLTNAAFFQAIFGAFTNIVQLAHMRHDDLKVSSLAQTMRPLVDIAWERHSGTNKKAIADLTKHIVELISSDLVVSKELL